ncbi:alpha/beta hydrolase [Chitinivorax sp. PXF-14]|uniref:alpha/beta fold hydrolase n=1 Tax=Chitinivorax sp. PXF-14 TaxID=3230488 RepID=UPI003465B9C6
MYRSLAGRQAYLRLAQLRLLFALLALFAVAGCSGTVAVKDIPLETLKAKYANAESKFVDIDGTMVHYRIEGKGPTIVLLHGIVASLQTWDGWTERLKGRYRIVRLDVPGFGLTGPMASGNYTTAGYVDFLDKFLARVGVDNCVMAGNSLGAFFAWNYAVAHPEKVSKLVLLDSPGFQQPVPFIVKLAQTPGADKVVTSMTPRFMVAANLRDVYMNKGLVTDALVDRYYEMTLRPGNRDAYVKIFREMVERSKTDSPGIDKITMPTLIMWGKQDPWVPLSVAMRWLKALPSAQYVFYDGVGHMPMEELPWRSSQDLDRFIQTGSVGTETVVNMR